MNVRNCRKCGSLFNYIAGMPICPECKEKLENKFKEVKEYIDKHQGCGVAEVSRECEVESSQIQQWLREERLQFSSDSMISLNCESCGAPIRSGRYCDACKANLINGFSQAIKKPEAPKPENRDAKATAKMRFLG